MIKPPIPANETLRLAALESYQILDMPAERALDTLTRAAALLCETPVAVISLVDRNRQWFLSVVGLDATETSREVSFCGHTILGEEVFEVPDALRDERFCDNPLVVGEPNIRFYAGAPLKAADQLHLGALCVIDRKPRRLNERKRAILAELSAVVMQLLEQRKAEIVNAARLKESNRLLAMGEVVAQFGSHQFNSATKEIRWSDGLARICGLDKGYSQPSYAETLSFFHPEDRAAAVGRGESVRASGSGASGEARIFRRDGTPREVQIWIEPWRAADGSVGSFGVIQDITVRKGAEREAERQRDRFSALFDTIADAILIADFATGQYVEVNESACQMFGYAKSELLDLSIGQLSSGISPFTADEVTERNKQWRLGETKRFESQFKTKDGVVFWGETSVRHARFGGTQAVLAVVRDITERKAIEREAERERHRFRALFDTIADGIMVSDPETGRYIEANEAACRMFGYTKSEMLALEVGELSSGIHPYTREAVVQQNKQLGLGQTKRFEWQYRNRHCALFWAEVSVQHTRFGDSTAVLKVIRDITDRKAAEREAERQRERFTALFDTVADGILITEHATGRCLEANEPICRMFGYTKPELLACDIGDLSSGIHPYGLEVALERQSRKRTGDTSHFEWQCKTKGGHLFWAELSVRYADFGAAPAMLAVIRDITERKTAERALIEAKESAERANVQLKEVNRLRETGEWIAHFGTFQANVMMKHMRWSDELYRIFGLDKADGSPTQAELTAYFHPEDRQRLAALHEAKWWDSGNPWTELRIIRPDGTQRDVQLWGEKAPVEDGSTGVFGVIQDITERKTAEREAERSRNRFNTLFNSVAEAILITDPETGRYLEVNEAACRLFGYSKPELLACSIGDLSSGVYPYTQDMALKRTRDQPEGSAWVFEWQNKTKDGAVFWSEISLRYARLGDTTALLKVVRDITARKNAERELIDLKERAERASRAKTAFLATISHEIRTPMNGVLGMNALLLETDLTAHQRKLAQTARHSAEALLHLLDGILDMAKLEAEQVTLDDAPFDLPTLAENVVDLFMAQAQHKGLTLSARIDDCARGAFRGAPNRLRQILLNLVANAVKFTQSGGVSVAISPAPGEAGGVRLRFEVSDSGIGVSAEAKPRLFSPFEQADPSITQRFGGTGLGLSISRKLVELMGGEIGVDDRPGGGSVFWFEIALRRAEPAESDASATAVPGAVGEAPTKAGRILLAEDDKVNVEVATLTLTAAGYQIEVAGDGAQALAAARRSDFDVILMDVRMPGMDGLTATRAIRAQPGPRGRAPIIALTANAMAEERRACFEAGMDDFVTKPFAPNLLRETVARWMNGAARSSPEPTSPADDEPVIDAAVSDELRSVMTQAQFAALVQMFVVRAEAQALLLTRALAASTLDEIADEAHRIVSSAGALGARRAQKGASRLENACRAADRGAVPGLIDGLARALAEACAELRRGLAPDEDRSAARARSSAL